MINLTLRKKFSLIFFLISLIRRVYVCLTQTGCKGCEFEQMCDEESEMICRLVQSVSISVRDYILSKE